MQVILQEDYPSLGFVGDLVKVKAGFARNYLLPQKIALPVSEHNIELLEHRKKLLVVKIAEKKQIALQLKEKIEKTNVTIVHAAGEGGRLFGSVTVAEIQAELLNSGIDIDRKLIRLEAPIKNVGESLVEIKLHQEVQAKLKVIVEGKIDKLAAKKAAKPKVEKIAKTDEGTEAQTETATEETSDA